MRLIRTLVLSAASLLTLPASSQINGTADSGITYAAGKFGTAATGFAGNKISIPDFTSALGNDYSRVFWFKKTGNPSGVMIMIGGGGASNASIPATWAGIQTGGNLVSNSYGATQVNGSTTVTEGTFHQVIQHYTSTTLTVYMDHVQVATGASSGTVTGGEAIGSSLDGSYPSTSDTLIDEVAYFTGNRFTAETATPTSPYTGTEPNLLHLYHLNGNANDSAGTTSPPPFSGSVAASPTSFPLGVATPFTLTGTGTSWTTSTLPTVAGGTGAYLSNMVVSGQTITGTLYPGTAAGTLTLGDTTDSGTTSVTAAPNLTAVVSFDGDSLTRGYKGTGDNTNQAIRLQTVVNGLGPAATAINTGVGGQTIAQMTARLSANACANYQAGKTNYLVIEGGPNDIANGRTVLQIEADWQTYIAAAKACHADWRIVWETILPGANPGSSPPLYDSLRSTVNTWIRGNWQALGIYAVSDVAADQLIGQSGQEYNTAYYDGSDHLHLTDAGYTRMGLYDLGAILAAPSTGTARTNRVF